MFCPPSVASILTTVSLSTLQRKQVALLAECREMSFFGVDIDKLSLANATLIRTAPLPVVNFKISEIRRGGLCKCLSVARVRARHMSSTCNKWTYRSYNRKVDHTSRASYPQSLPPYVPRARSMEQGCARFFKPLSSILSS